MPTLRTQAPEPDAPQREQLITELCAQRTTTRPDGVLSHHRARARAAALLRDVCD